MQPGKIDPYKVLQVNYDASLEKIRENFKKIVLKVHPDRGGNTESFVLVKTAYTQLYKIKMHEKKIAKKRNYMQMQKQRSNDEDVKLRLSQALVKKLTNDMGSFNKIYEEVRTKTVYDEGYGNMSSEDIDRITTNSKAVKIYRDPEGVQIDGGGAYEYEELGKNKVKNFGKTSLGGGTSYSDFLEAYTEKDISNMKNVRVNEYRNLDELVSSRGNIQYTKNQRNQMYYDRQIQNQQKHEALRRQRLHSQDLQAKKSFHYLQRQLEHY